jgi:ElaB/YqjD/DUF883 family membrane-anchored ribosome-binding protein
MDDATGRVDRKRKTARSSAAAIERETIDPTLPKETDVRAREIREEIAQTRDNISETLGQIQDRLKPSTIVAEAGERVKSATTEKVKQMANTAEYAADRVVHNRFMDTVRENPWPVAMIGLGAAWLWMNGRSDSRRYPTRRYAYRGDDYRRDEYDVDDGWGASTAPTRVVYSLGDEEGIEYGEVPGDRRSASDYIDEVRSRTRQTTRRAQNSVNRVLRENPLALGAAATLVGVAIGMSLPETEVENEWMGEARDTVVERAREMASNAAERVESAADQVKDVASRTLDATKVP